MTSHCTWGSVTTLTWYNRINQRSVTSHLHDFGGEIGTTFGHFLLGSHDLMVTALGSCVEVALTYLVGALAFLTNLS